MPLLGIFLSQQLKKHPPHTLPHLRHGRQNPLRWKNKATGLSAVGRQLNEPRHLSVGVIKDKVGTATSDRV